MSRYTESRTPKRELRREKFVTKSRVVGVGEEARTVTEEVKVATVETRCCTKCGHTDLDCRC